ncbi:MAG: hypothetical protein H7A43_03590 [Verrucomicrobia bacterium]|nr:hypothetical protein [Verrucomicrobiota bacterium]
MILSQDQSLIVSSLGWTDTGGLWVLETRSGGLSTPKISDAKYLSLHQGSGDFFSIIHHYDADQILISVHSFADPPKVLARVSFGPSGNSFEGDASVWPHVPKAYVAYFKRPALSDFHLFLIEPIRPSAEVVGLDWYDDSYDKGYQGVIGVVEVPDEDNLVISVQRDSHPVLYDLDQRRVISKLSLADRSGNPTLRFTRQSRELWADDYDTLLRLSPPDWKVRDTMLLQDASAGCRQFIGAYSFNQDESLCAVARPFSGDVVALNTSKFRITHTCNLGQQPLLVSLLSDGTVYARDWKTGRLLKGTLKKKWIT